METKKIEISQKTIIFTVGLILSLWFLFQVRSIIVLLFIAFILMTAVNPLVKIASRFKIPTILVMLVVYFGLITLISTVILSSVPAVQQTKDISLALPTYLHNLEDVFNTQLDPNVAGSYLSSIPSNLLKIAAGAFSNIMNILALFFMAYYLVLERPKLHRYLLRLFDNDKDQESRAEALVLAVERQVGGWVRGELVLMLIIGVMTYVSLILLGIPYALPLAVLAGILEAVPNLGPTIAAIPAILIGLTVSPIIGLGALIASIVIQQVESNWIVPKVMQSATGTEPLVTIVVLLIGFTLGGVAGAVLSMPIYLTIQTVVTAMAANKK
jgi:predicted PurR-regulated permease PerM